MSAPTLHIVLTFEGAPVIYVDALDDSEAVRLRDWIEAHPDQAELLARAYELTRERAA